MKRDINISEVNSKNKWLVIKILRSLMICIQLGFLIGGILIFLIYNANEVEQHFDILWKTMAIGFLVIILIPNPCPRCSKTYLMLSVMNWHLMLIRLFKNMFSPIQLLSILYTEYCPHCDLPINGDTDIK